AEDQSAFELRLDRIGIDGDSGIHHRGHPAQQHFALFVDFGFHYACDEGSERWLQAHAAPDACRQRLTPVGFLSRKIERRKKARLLAKHRAAEFYWILAGLAGKLVHETFDGKHIVVGTDAAP